MSTHCRSRGWAIRRENDTEGLKNESELGQQQESKQRESEIESEGDRESQSANENGPQTSLHFFEICFRRERDRESNSASKSKCESDIKSDSKRERLYGNRAIKRLRTRSAAVRHWRDCSLKRLRTRSCHE